MNNEQHFIVWHCTLLCTASYGRDPVDKLRAPEMSAHRFTSCSVSDDGAYTGRFLIAEAVDLAGKGFTFICFRGSDNWDDVRSDFTFFPSITEAGAAHAGFFDRVETFPLDALMDAVQRGRRVVVTGHSLGGACAILLATRFFNKYGTFSYIDGEITSVTFGSPLVGGPSMGVLMNRRAKHFHNYLYDKDVIPLALTLVKDIIPLLLTPVLGELVGPAVGEAVAQVVRALFDYTPFGKFYFLSPDNDIPVDRLHPLSAAQVKAYFEQDISDRLKDLPRAISSHFTNNYANALFASHGLRLPSSGSETARLPGVCIVPEIEQCEVKGAEVYIYGRGLFYCTALTLGGWSLSLSTEFRATGERAIFRMSEADTIDGGPIRHLAEAQQRRQATELTVYNYFGVKSAPTQIHVTVGQAEDYLTPGMILSFALPIATLLAREEGAANDPTQRCFESMLQHAKALADALPIEFAFRALEDDSSDTESEFLQTFLQRMADVHITWEDLCSHVMVGILRRAIEGLGRDKKISQARLELICKAFECEPYQLTVPNLFKVTHPVMKGALVVGTVFTQEAFWKVVCGGRQGVSFSVDLFADTPGSITSYFPAVGKPMYVEGGYTVSNDPVNRLCDGVEFYEITITHNLSGLRRHFCHFIVHWGAAELPSEASFVELIDNVQLVMKESLYLRGTNCRDPCVLVPDHTAGGAGGRQYRVSLFAFCLTQRFAIKSGATLDQSTLAAHLAAQAGEPGSGDQVAPLTQVHFDFAQRCKLNNVTDLVRLMRHAFTGETNPMTEARDKLREHLYQMRIHYESVYKEALCGYSITMPVHTVADPNAPATPFLDLFPSKITRAHLDAPSPDHQFLINKADESSMKANFLSMMLEDAMTLGENAVETERALGLGKVALHVGAAIESILIVPWAAYKAAYSLFVAGNSADIIDVEAAYAGKWHRARYESMKLSKYKDIVSEVSRRLKFNQLNSSTLIEKEKFIVDCLPHGFATRSLKQLIDEMDTIFKGERYVQLLAAPRTAGMVIFFLKTIYHCYHLRCLRRQITLVTIAGEKNAGKTSLNKKIFGKKVVTAPTGTGKNETTRYPSAYSHPDKPDLIYCDLPGTDDAATARISDMFLTVGDITIFLIDQLNAVNPRAGDPIYDTVRRVLSSKGPRLICITHGDRLFERPQNAPAGTIFDAATKLKDECDKWRTSALFAGAFTARGAPLLEPWECENVRPGAVIASVRTADSALSVWMTSFKPENSGKEDAKRLLFNAEHVKAWVAEAHLMCKTLQGNSV
jgi:pimeloyl-ACP methyl ester carboxylesterase/DNA-binding Xre family transcriptional regulator